MLISAGAVDLDRAHELCDYKWQTTQLRSAPARRRSGLPADTDTSLLRKRASIEKIRAAGGYKAYEKAHRQRLVAMFLAEIPRARVKRSGRVLEFTERERGSLMCIVVVHHAENWRTGRRRRADANAAASCASKSRPGAGAATSGARAFKFVNAGPPPVLHCFSRAS